MSSRSRGFWARVFGGGGGGGRAETGLFKPAGPRTDDLPAAGLPPASPPGIVIDPPRPDPPPQTMPADVPPPPPPLTLADVARLKAGPEAAPEPEPLALAAPVAEVLADRPTQLASVLAEQPLPEPARPVVAVEQPPPPRVPAGYAELIDLPAVAVAVRGPGFWAGQMPRLAVAPVAPLPAPTPLLEGTEPFTNAYPINWHRTARPLPPRDLACYFATDAVVSGPGHIWLGDRLVTSTELMPAYVYRQHNLPADGVRLLEAHALKLREIAAPCVVLLGHGLQVYGHFVIELLFRLLLVRRALRGTGLAVRWLLDADAPAWLARILHDELGVAPDAIEFFRAGEERVLLRNAILPGLVHCEEGFHPFTNALIEDLLTSLAPLPEVAPAPLLFIARRGFRNPHSPNRECENEAALVALAEARGFVSITAEDLPWRQQLALFGQAKIVLGLFGSALHTALVSPAGTRVGVLGLNNPTQSEIASLRGHRIGYLTNGFESRDQYRVPEDAFAAFLDALCAPATTERPATERPARPASAPAAAAIERPGPGHMHTGRLIVAAAAAPRAPLPLLAGTEPFALPSQRALHREPRQWPAREAVCVVAEDAIVGPGGLVWLDDAAADAPVDAPDLLARPLGLAPEAVAAAAALPLRDIDTPCVAIPGPGPDNYIGFMAETLPRLLLARRAVRDGGKIRLLLDAAAPSWLVRMLRVDLGLTEDELERFAPAIERVRVRRALLPGVLYGPGGFHPLLSELLDQLIGRLALADVAAAPRLLVQRPVPRGASPEQARGDCRNEAALQALAEAQGFVPVMLDALPWRERVAWLRGASVVLAGPGVAPTALLLADAGKRVAVVGARGGLMTEVGALRGHRMAYLSEGVPPRGPYTLQENRFAEFLAAICEPDAEVPAAA